MDDLGTEYDRLESGDAINEGLSKFCSDNEKEYPAEEFYKYVSKQIVKQGKAKGSET